MTTNGNAISMFISYAHEDEPLLRQLETHLSLLKRQNLVAAWHDRQIPAGTDWAGEIDARLEQASIILLLVSADFLASDYCYEVEMKCALERHEAGQARVLPIALRPTDWQGALFAHRCHADHHLDRSRRGVAQCGEGHTSSHRRPLAIT